MQATTISNLGWNLRKSKGHKALPIIFPMYKPDSRRPRSEDEIPKSF